MMNNNNSNLLMKRYCLAAFVLCFCLLLLPSVFAAASFQVTQIACPSGAKVGSWFSCTVTIRNSGDASGTVGTVTLYPNADNWLEQANYVKTVNSQNVGVGDSVEVTFPGMKATKGGAGKFSEVRIDEASDSSSIVTGYTMNIIDVSVIVTSSATSGGINSNFTTTAEVIASGEVLVTLSFAVDSGGCSIGDYESQKTLDMSHNSRQSHTWTVRMGSSGNCKYTVTALATEKGTVALVTDNMQTTVSCTDCPVDSGSSSSSSGGGGGGGGGGSTTAASELVGSVSYTLGLSEKVAFLLDGKNHSVTVSSIAATSAEIIVRSEPQTIVLNIGQEKRVDVDGDGKEDLVIQLKNINILTKKVTLVLTSLVVPSSENSESAGQSGAGESEAQGSGAGAGSGSGSESDSGAGAGLGVIAVILLIAGLFIAILYVAWHRSPEHRLRSMAEKVTWHANKGLAEPWVDAAKKKG